MKTEQIPGAMKPKLYSEEQPIINIPAIEKKVGWRKSDQDELNTQLLKASIAKQENKKKKEGLGHQFNSEGKGLKACESFLRQASKSLDGTIQTDLKVRIELLITDVIAEAAAAQDRFNDNA